MPPDKSWRPKAAVWLVLVASAAVLAFLAERQITFVAGVPFSGYVKVFVTLFAAILFILLCGWGILWLMLQRLHPKPPETSNHAMERTAGSSGSRMRDEL
jgi:flagellar biogenesis protein FliO